jgi:hypothetical protein
LEQITLVFLKPPLNKPSGVSTNYRVRLYIFGNNRSSRHYCSIADSDPGEDHCVCTYPTVATDLDITVRTAVITNMTGFINLCRKWITTDPIRTMMASQKNLYP